MADEERDVSKRPRKFLNKASRAIAKAAIFTGIYFVVSILLAPVSELVPGFQQTLEAFAIVYIFLVIVGELSSGTIYQCLFNAAKSLFLILYLFFSLGGGTVGLTYQDVHLAVDLRLFLMVAMLLGLLGFAKSVLQSIEFLSEKTEHTQM